LKRFFFVFILAALIFAKGGEPFASRKEAGFFPKKPPKESQVSPRAAGATKASFRNTSKAVSRDNIRRVFLASVTAYCSCEKCCGKSDGITASGIKAHWGMVAAPRWLPFGTKLKIEGFDTVFTVEDRGGAIKGNRLDIWFPSHEEALKFGVKRLRVEVFGIVNDN
jgi:3D (Asp-Asp-Asp) domain-containing protein